MKNKSINIEFLDSKSIIIVLLLIGCLFFGYKWYFDNTSKDHFEKIIEQKDRENKRISMKRDSIKEYLDLLKEKYDSIEKFDSNLKKDILKLKKDIEREKEKVKITTMRLNNLKNRFEKVRKEIKKLEKTKNTKSDKELIKSLKNKLKS